MALIQKYPALNYLDEDVDGTEGRAPYHTIYRLLSRKKRNIKYSKTHPTPKRSRLSSQDKSSNDNTDEISMVEQTVTESVQNELVECDHDNVFDENLIDQLLTESNITENLTLLPEPVEKLTSAPPPSTKTPTQPQIIVNDNKRATISLVTSLIEPNPPSQSTSISSSFVNNSIVSTTPLIVKPIVTTNAPTNLIYHNGRMHVNSVPLQSVVAVHKAIAPRACEKKQKHKENNSRTCTEPPNKATQNILIADC